MKYYNKRPALQPDQPGRRLEIVVAEGLEPLARRELGQFGRALRLENDERPGVIRARYTGDLRALSGLRLAASVYLARHFAVPRPRALLGDEHLRLALADCQTVLRLYPQGTFHTLFLSAAGADSAVLLRLKTELARRLGLAVGSDDGDLLLRLRRDEAQTGWEWLVRISPRPLATRSWRVCNMEGALNGPVACAMNLLTAPAAGDVYLNIGCGSGTLLIERLLLAPAKRAIGCDTDPQALACTRANLEAAGVGQWAEVQPWDARALPLPDAAVDVITGDLPFGHLVGSHAQNLELYPALLAEAARVARPGARCALLSHEVRLMERLLADSPVWRVNETILVDLGGLYPRIFVLRRA
ncbi:MAG: methyltransferase domain-containing protein [Chloroflexaceae bacterium]|nr:methyltransferase domain-containing protein [Chloroflexaceae bacterium]